MGWLKCNAAKRNRERGATLYIFTASLFLLVGMAAFAIDLASMYVARNQSQRAADAAALAGAKYFAESGCVTNGSCAGFETTAIARATEVAAQSNVEGQPVTIVGTPAFDMVTVQNPQITVSVQSANLNLYFLPALGHMANVVGAGGSLPMPITVGATATAEAYNPSGIAGGPTYCTGCVRPWLIPNCDQTIAAGPNPLCNSATPSPEAYLLTPGSYSVANPGCYPGGVIGEPIEIPLPTPTAPASMTTLYGALDVDSPGIGNFFDYQGAIPICSTTQPTSGQTTCGVYPAMNILPIGPLPSLLGTSTINGVDALLHLAPGATGIIGQDTIVAGSCPVQIQAGSANPVVVQGIVGPGTLIATSDSIVTAYIYDTPPTTAGYTGLSYNTLTDHSQIVSIVGFAQIFVSQVDANGNIFGNILGVAGCGNNPNASCGLGSGNGTSINGPTLIPVRLITPGP